MTEEIQPPAEVKPKRGRRMKRRRHFRTPPPPKPPVQPSFGPPPFAIKIPADIPDAVIQDLLQDLDKVEAEQSTYFKRLIHNGKVLPIAEQKLKRAIILSVVCMENGNMHAAARRLKIHFQTVQRTVKQHNDEYPSTPDSIKREQEHLKTIQNTINKGVESLTALWWEAAGIAVKETVSLLKSGDIKPEALARIGKIATEKALALESKPAGRGARIAERTMPDDQLQEVLTQNQQILDILGAVPDRTLRLVAEKK